MHGRRNGHRRAAGSEILLRGPRAEAVRARLNAPKCAHSVQHASMLPGSAHPFAGHAARSPTPSVVAFAAELVGARYNTIRTRVLCCAAQVPHRRVVSAHVCSTFQVVLQGMVVGCKASGLGVCRGRELTLPTPRASLA